MRPRYSYLLIATLLVVALTAACGSTPDTGDTAPADTSGGEAVYRTLTIDEFADILADNPENYTIINVHIPYAGEIEGTDQHVAFNDIDALTAALPDKDAPTILYCRSGNMSEQASRELVDLGYTQVWDVPGGMVAWEESGREIVDR